VCAQHVTETDFAMQRWTNFALRAAFIVGFLVVLPLMAMPSVASFLDQLLYGTSEKSLPPAQEPRESAPLKTLVRADVSPAGLEVPVSEQASAAESESGRFAPPPLQRAPDFVKTREPVDGPDRHAQPADDVGPLDQATAARIDAVRSRLEELGAEYIRLEMSEDGQNYHCLCEMLVGEKGDQTQPFTATRSDPVDAAQAVLARIEAWRAAESAPKDGPQRRSR